MPTKRTASVLFIFLVNTLAPATVVLEVNKLAVSGITELQIHGKCLDIDMYGNKGDSVYMVPHEVSNSVQIKSSKSGAILTVWVENIDSPDIPFCRGTMAFTVPAGLVVDIENKSGDISLERVRARKVAVENLMGSIDIDRSDAIFKIKTKAGSVDMEYCDGSMHIDTKLGQIDVEHCTGKIRATSTLGSQDYEFIEGDLKATSIAGSIDIDNFKGSLALISRAGSQDGDNITILDSAYFETSAGSISMDFRNNLDEFTFMLASSVGSLEVGHIQSFKTLRYGEGPIPVVGISRAGSQEYD
ncbi:MAG: hypothetical protein GF398_00580 [Chitinivibrionales bacterium]|nr:hypothetical protein [Chitinivibrionales bacterium]